MHSWFKTFGRPTRSWAVGLLRTSATVILAVGLLPSNALPQSEPEGLGMSANELMRKVVASELKSQNEDHDHWMYRLEKEESGKRQAQEILETHDGSLSRLLSVGGHPLDAQQQQKENQRLQGLVSHPMNNGNCSRPAARRQNKGPACSEFCRIYFCSATRVVRTTL